MSRGNVRSHTRGGKQVRGYSQNRPGGAPEFGRGAAAVGMLGLGGLTVVLAVGTSLSLAAAVVTSVVVGVFCVAFGLSVYSAVQRQRRRFSRSGGGKILSAARRRQLKRYRASQKVLRSGGGSWHRRMNAMERVRRGKP